MKMCMCRFFWCVFIAIISSACSASDESVSVQAFWQKFRGDVIAGNKSKIAEATRFPLHVHGLSDQDPVQKCTRQCFDDMYDRLINQIIYLPDGDAITKNTMSSLIAAQEKSGYDERVEKNAFRVYQLEFHFTSGRWLLTDAYLEE